MKQMVLENELVTDRSSNDVEGLAKLVERWSPDEQMNPTRIDGLRLYKLSAPDAPHRCFYEPCLAVILRGRKKIMFGRDEITFGTGDLFVTSIDIPTSAHVVEATKAKPYLALIMRLDLVVLQQLTQILPDDGIELQENVGGLSVGKVSSELIAGLERLVSILDRPGDIPLISDLIEREIYLRLLQSPTGTWLRHAANQGYRLAGLVRAIDWLKRNYRQPVKIDDLAKMAGMAASTFHHNFRSLTGTSPLQYQKSLRLYAARSMMLIERTDVSTAAIRVGYESASQFSREYSRFFGVPPYRDTRRTRESDHPAVRQGQ